MRIHPAPVTAAFLYVMGVIFLAIKATVWVGVIYLTLAWLFAIAVALYYDRRPSSATT